MKQVCHPTRAQRGRLGEYGGMGHLLLHEVHDIMRVSTIRRLATKRSRDQFHHSVLRRLWSEPLVVFKCALFHLYSKNLICPTPFWHSCGLGSLSYSAIKVGLYVTNTHLFRCSSAIFAIINYTSNSMITHGSARRCKTRHQCIVARRCKTMHESS